MKAGDVVRLRLSPRDSVGCVRVCERIGMVLPGASLPVHVSLALRALLELARKQGFIPAEEDDFSAYAKIKNQFTTSHHRKLAVQRLLEGVTAQEEVQDRPNAALEARLDELIAKGEANPMALTEEDKLEMSNLVGKLKSSP